MKKIAPIVFIIIVVIIMIVLAISNKKNNSEDALETGTDVEVTDGTNTEGTGLTGIIADLQGQWALEGTKEAFIHIRDNEIAYAITGFEDYFPMRIEAAYIYVSTPEKEIKYTFDLDSKGVLMLMGEGEGEILKLVRP